ncbi:homeobox-leucine zipper protein HOX19-like [Oryza sativa Japonica Group]
MEEKEEMTMLSLGVGAASKHSISNRKFRLKEVTDHKFNLGDQDHNSGHVRKKLRLSEEQLTVLENMYEAGSNLDQALKQGLAEKLNIKPRQVEVWFQNRRARTKHKQIEEECKNRGGWRA